MLEFTRYFYHRHQSIAARLWRGDVQFNSKMGAPRSDPPFLGVIMAMKGCSPACFAEVGAGRVGRFTEECGYDALPAMVPGLIGSPRQYSLSRFPLQKVGHLWWGSYEK